MEREREHTEGVELCGSSGTRRVAIGRRGIALLAALALFAAGVLMASATAKRTASENRVWAREAFSAESERVASTLEMAIQQAEGLVVNASAYVAANPRTTPQAFAQWTHSAKVLERYPELLDLGLIVLVPRSELGAFSRRMLAHPVLPASRQPAGSRGDFRVLPEGERPYYCLASAGIVRARVASLPPGLDYCAAQSTLLRARDLDQTSYLPFKEGRITTLAVQTPVYRGGTEPTTVPARRRQFVGWLGESLVPQVLLSSALQGRRNVAVAFRYSNARTNVSFTSGHRPARGQSASIDLGNGWTVQTFAAAPAHGVLADRSALLWLFGGGALSALMALLLYVLSTGRARALSLVQQRTAELAHRALHDNLTGLPNRAQVAERAEELLAQGTLAAAMFVDLDGFKEINDGFGHAAGDALLKAVAARLRAAVRERDLVARLGGDEFVVLLDATAGETSPRVIAQRMIRSVRTPIRLEQGITVSVGASVGISMVARRSAAEVLHDADLALYAAKAAGKSRYRVYEPGMESSADKPHERARISARGERPRALVA